MTNSRPDIVIHPEPTDEELAAILAALEFLALESDAVVIPSQPSRWATIARRELMREALERNSV